MSYTHGHLILHYRPREHDRLASSRKLPGAHPKSSDCKRLITNTYMNQGPIVDHRSLFIEVLPLDLQSVSDDPDSSLFFLTIPQSFGVGSARR